jgi:hypothetical protein
MSRWHAIQPSQQQLPGSAACIFGFQPYASRDRQNKACRRRRDSRRTSHLDAASGSRKAAFLVSQLNTKTTWVQLNR